MFVVLETNLLAMETSPLKGPLILQLHIHTHTHIHTQLATSDFQTDLRSR